MRKISILITLAAGALLVSGCDFIRNIAGRPSADDVHLLSLAKKSSLEVADFIASDTVSFNANQEPEPVLEISRSKKVKEVEDQAKAEQEIRQIEQEMQKPEAESTKCPLIIRKWANNIGDPAGLSRYYVSIGIFSNETNARNQAKLASNSGYAPTIIKFINGRFCVCVCPSNTVAEIIPGLDNLLSKPFCPADAFIVDTKQ